MLYFFRFYLIRAETDHGSHLPGKETERIKEADRSYHASLASHQVLC